MNGTRIPPINIGGDNTTQTTSNPGSSSTDVDSTCKNTGSHNDIKELHIAPMLNVSTIEFRTFIRILTKRAIIWTEMIVDETIYFQRRQRQQQQQQQGKSTIVRNNLNNGINGDCDAADAADDNNDGSQTAATDDGDWTISPEILYPVSNDTDHPVVCQIGTINPIWTSIATQCILHANYNINEMNINLDCPSTRVQGKEFGAVLMQDVEKVITFVQAIQIHLPSHMCVSVKCRIGMIIDTNNVGSDTTTNGTTDTGSQNNRTTTTITDYDWIVNFIQAISVVCTRFILHARPVILHGLNKNHNTNNNNNNGSNNNNNNASKGTSTISPAQNRCIPPLNYMWVYQLCDQFPHCTFILNGGITNLIMARHICYGLDLPPPQSSSSSSSASSSPLSSSQNNVIDDYYKGHGTVPCNTCQQQYPGIAKYGSCIVPPKYLSPPHNLRGCMIGRAVIDHPIQFAKVDSFWYNNTYTEQNKATTRRQVLQQYCQFLDTLYPRRCCDSSIVVTSEIPSPNVHFRSPFCNVCQEFRQSLFVRYDPDDKLQSHTISNFENSVDNNIVPSDQQNQLDHNTTITTTTAPRIKIATRIIDRSIKPILNIFHGCYGSKIFKHSCEMLRRDTSIRNCGPAYIIYYAIAESNISNDILDESIV